MGNEQISDIVAQYSQEMREAEEQLKTLSSSITKLQIALQEMMIDYKNYQIKQQLIFNTFLLNMRELGYDVKLDNEVELLEHDCPTLDIDDIDI